MGVRIGGSGIVSFGAAVKRSCVMEGGNVSIGRMSGACRTMPGVFPGGCNRTVLNGRYAFVSHRRWLSFVGM